MKISSKYLETKGINIRQVSYKAGSTIFHEKDFGREMYFVESGKVKITKMGLDKEIVLTKLFPDQYFGEMGLITGRPRTATARALDDCMLSVLEWESFGQAISVSPEFAMDIMATLARRLEFTDDGVKKSIEELRSLKNYIEANKDKAFTIIDDLIARVSALSEFLMP